MIRNYSSAFALPTVMITSLVMLSVLLMALSGVASTSSALRQQHIARLAHEAAQSGLAVALTCLEANSYGAPAGWDDGNPLRPNTDCAAANQVTPECTNESIDARCFVLNEGTYRTTFEATYDVGDDSNITQLNAVGIVDTVRTTGSATIERFRQTLKLNIASAGGGGGSTTAQVSTLAGSSIAGNDNGTGADAEFDFPYHLDVDSSGNVYVSDSNNGLVRKITPAGVVSYFTEYDFYGLYGIAVEDSGNVYITEWDDYSVIVITPQGYMDGIAYLEEPYGVATDSSGNIYVAEHGESRILKIDMYGDTDVLAGSGTAGYLDGTGTAARFRPKGVAADSSGNVYVADTGNNRIRKITPAGVTTTLAGESSGSADGTGTEARFRLPEGITVDNSGNIYVADTENHCIRKLEPEGSVAKVTTIAGICGTEGFNDGNGAEALFDKPAGIAVDDTGSILYVADSNNNRIRKIVLGSTPSGGGSGELQLY